MFLVAINTILESIAEIFYKKSLLTSNLRPTIFQFIFECIGLVFVIGMIIIFGFNYRLVFDAKIIVWFLVLAVSFITYNNIAQKLYREEKMSAIIPYFKINNFLIIIAGFLFFRDASLVSFFICLAALGVVAWWSYNPEERAMPKNLWLVIVHELLRTIELLVIVFLLKYISSVEYMVLYQFSYLFVAFFLVLFLGEFIDIKKLNWSTIKYRSSSYVMWFLWYFIDTFLLKEYGLIVATLFGFFWSSLSLILAYIMFKEIPSKKDIMLWIILMILVGFGYYYR